MNGLHHLTLEVMLNLREPAAAWTVLP